MTRVQMVPFAELVLVHGLLSSVRTYECHLQVFQISNLFTHYTGSIHTFVCKNIHESAYILYAPDMGSALLRLATPGLESRQTLYC